MPENIQLCEWVYSDAATLVFHYAGEWSVTRDNIEDSHNN
jgi:hypothetical protein